MLTNLIFHHIGIATKSLKKAIKTYQKLGFIIKIDITAVPSENVHVVFLEKLNHPLIELIEPLDDNSPISNILQKSGSGPYHKGYFTDNLSQTLTSLRNEKFTILNAPSESVVYDNNLYFFAYKSDIGLIEIIEYSN